MSLSQIFKKVLIPCAAGVATASDAEGHTYGSNCVKRVQEGTRPSDLPIYSKDCNVCREASEAPPPASGMEETVGNIRRELWVWQDNLKGYRHKIVDVYRRGFSKADCPEPKKSRNHLESSFDDKLTNKTTYQSRTNTEINCQRQGTPSPSRLQLCLDRCGRPCKLPPSQSFPQKAPKQKPYICPARSQPPPSEGPTTGCDCEKPDCPGKK